MNAVRLRRNKDVAQRSEIDSNIRVNERRDKRGKDRKGGRLGDIKSKEPRWDERECGSDKHFDDVIATIGKNIHFGLRMVHCVKEPQRRELVVHPVIDPTDEISNNKCEDRDLPCAENRDEVSCRFSEDRDEPVAKCSELHRNHRESEDWCEEKPTEVDHKAMRERVLIFSAGENPLHHEKDCSKEKEPWFPDCGKPLSRKSAESSDRKIRRAEPLSGTNQGYADEESGRDDDDGPSKPRLLFGVSFLEYIDSRRHDSVVPSVGNRAPDSRGEVGSHVL